jgi:hypothetical protein
VISHDDRFEKLLYVWQLNPDLLEPDDRTAIEHHLGGCEICEHALAVNAELIANTLYALKREQETRLEDKAKTTFRPVSESQYSPHSGAEDHNDLQHISPVERNFALAADDGQMLAVPQEAELFPLTEKAITVSGQPRIFLTDGRNVFIALQNGDDNRSGLLFDKQRVELSPLPENARALLVAFGRAKFTMFVTRMNEEPGQHFIQWATDPI